jgi:hypothetical protein
MRADVAFDVRFGTDVRASWLIEDLERTSMVEGRE